MSYNIERFDANRHDPKGIAAMHLQIRRWQESTGQNTFSNIFDSQPDLLAIEDFYASPGGFWVAHKGNTVVGFVGLRWAGDGRAEVKRLAVAPEFHRQGVATELVNTVICYAESVHVMREVTLCTNFGEHARPIYERHGFAVVSETLNASGDWRMVRSLQNERRGR